MEAAEVVSVRVAGDWFRIHPGSFTVAPLTIHDGISGQDHSDSAAHFSFRDDTGEWVTGPMSSVQAIVTTDNPRDDADA